MRDQNSDQDCVGLPARSCFRSKSHAHAEDPRMIIHRCQRIRYVVIGYQRDLTGDAEVNFHTVVDLKTERSQRAGFCRRARRSSIACR
jgi:hypothetical protein